MTAMEDVMETEAVEGLARALRTHDEEYEAAWRHDDKAWTWERKADRILAALRADPAAARAVRDAIDPDGLRAWKPVAIQLLSTMKGIARDRSVTSLANARSVAINAVSRIEPLIEGTPDAD